MKGEGVELPSYPDIDKAADKYVEERDARMEMTPKEIKAKEKLLELMQKHNLEVYRFGDQEIKRTKGKENVKVKKIKPDEPQDD